MGAFAFDSANGATLVLPWVSMLPVFVSHGVVMTMMITVVTYFHGIIVAMMMITMMCVMAVLLTLLMVPRCDDYYGGSNIGDGNFRGPLPSIGGSMPQLLIAFRLRVLAFNLYRYTYHCMIYLWMMSPSPRV